jgi:hypothetical protein
VKGQKNEILTRPKSRPDVFYFLPGVYSDAIGTHFIKQLPTHIAHIAKAPEAIAETKGLAKSAILLTQRLKNSFKINKT